MDLPLIMTIERNLSALNSRLAQVRAVVQGESKVWGPETVEDISLRSSMKARSKGNSVLLMVNLVTLTCKDQYNVHISTENDYRKGAGGKYSPFMSMPNTCC